MDKGRMECWDQNSQAVSVHLPRIMIAAEKSGGGKTLFTCALLSLLKEKIREVRAFKCGPDYIDPMFHRTVLEIPSRNLDSFFCGRGYAEIFARQGSPRDGEIPGKPNRCTGGRHGLLRWTWRCLGAVQCLGGGGPYGYAGDPSGGYEGAESFCFSVDKRIS